MNQSNSLERECTFLIIGGGIAGVSCTETISFLAPDLKIILITESSLIKSVTNLTQLGKFTEKFEVEEVNVGSYSKPNMEVITDQLKTIETNRKIATTQSGIKINYKFLCLCTGARPKLIEHPELGQYILGIRDTESVLQFQKRIVNAKKFVLVGNGGIASEIAYEVGNIEIDWVIKDSHITSTFIDAGAAKFFESNLKNKSEKVEKSVIKRMRYMEKKEECGMKNGAALGPDWHRLIDIAEKRTKTKENVNIHYQSEVKNVSKNNDEHAILVELTNGSQIACDFIVSATGVNPYRNFHCDKEFVLQPDGGIEVDDLMKTSIESIYAAGDCCTAGWKHSNFWFQMKLWTQARQMGAMAGKSMVAEHNQEPIYQDFCFELFSHVTKLYGYQVVLLGKFNAQGLDDNYDLLFRITPDKEYIKFVLFEGKLIGALLIGETGLEETCENLILNQIDLTPYGDDILDPNIDIEDYFD
ncbi:unnamed protein product [Diamesa hyperborea]